MNGLAVKTIFLNRTSIKKYQITFFYCLFYDLFKFRWIAVLLVSSQASNETESDLFVFCFVDLLCGRKCGVCQQDKQLSRANILVQAVRNVRHHHAVKHHNKVESSVEL